MALGRFASGSDIAGAGGRVKGRQTRDEIIPDTAKRGESMREMERCAENLPVIECSRRARKQKEGRFKNLLNFNTQKLDHKNTPHP